MHHSIGEQRLGRRFDGQPVCATAVAATRSLELTCHQPRATREAIMPVTSLGARLAASDYTAYLP
eukprot:2742655-Prymnesium_polylepis.1